MAFHDMKRDYLGVYCWCNGRGILLTTNFLSPDNVEVLWPFALNSHHLRGALISSLIAWATTRQRLTENPHTSLKQAELNRKYEIVI